jgi:sporulation protein YlmC with PRC-barrel domain
MTQGSEVGAARLFVRVKRSKSMKALKLARLIGAMTVVASTPALMAVAVHAQQSPPATESAPPATRPELAPRPVPIDPQKPSGPAVQEQKPTTPGTLPNAPNRPQAATPPAEKTGPEALVGLAVFGSDGQKVGEVREVKAQPDGKVMEIHIKTGGFLGFGGKTVAIPAAKFNKSGQNVQLAMTAADVTKLPVVTDKPS